MHTHNATRWTSTAALLLVLTAVMVAAAPETDAQVPATDTAPAGGSGDQPQMVSTSGGTFWNSVGYLLVTLLVGGSLYAVCRSSHRN